MKTVHNWIISWTIMTVCFLVSAAIVIKQKKQITTLETLTETSQAQVDSVVLFIIFVLSI